ncbi:serine protease [Candidatus Thioglobus autotrophicus]|jgi:S1-C subfamily serine protease|uniref:S1C family serine protease n=1 Tax=Candidatus Thioglobus autotrophicus TaxID=1705394 RepID=UPI00299D43D5|nr:serine protease [Candidatus Thioglobus autotrophicus]WPE16589.1 serine protease [Candidatus Thioglobus autotrophicus]
MKTKLLPLLLIIASSIMSSSNAEFRFDDEDIEGHSISAQQSVSYRPIVHLICTVQGKINGEFVNREIEVFVQPLTSTKDSCLAVIFDFPHPGLGPSGLMYGDILNGNSDNDLCISTYSFIKVKRVHHHPISQHTNLYINRISGMITASYNEEKNEHREETALSVKGQCRNFIKKNINKNIGLNTKPPALSKIPKKGKGYSSGTGFYVNKKGIMITNNHVVKNCSKIKVDGSNAVVKSFDTTNDLALLQVESLPASVPDFRSGRGIRLGDGVTVAGYPLRSVLGSGLNVVTGTVASLSGIKNNSSRLQITAPVNSGNSGGPLFDSFGRVVGVIVSKINNAKAREILGEEIQGANFAIKGSIVKSFMDMNDVDYKASSSNKNMSTADIAENAKKYTSLIKCWK